MGSLFRSEDMSFCDMYLHADDAYECVNRLGELGICQFKDMNSQLNVFQRHFVREIRKLEEMERILRYFEGELQRETMEPFEEVSDHPVFSQSLNEMTSHLEKTETAIRNMASNVEQLEKSHNELIELSNVLTKTREYFQTINPEFLALEKAEMPDETGETTGRATLRYTAGVIPTNRVYGFTRLLYFATRGASFCRFSDVDGQIKDPSTGNLVNKSVFLVLCSGEQLHSKINKIAEGFHATLYPCPDTEEGRSRAVEGVQQRLRDLELILVKSRETQEDSLREIARNLTSWKVKVIRMKACYHILNMFHYEGNGLIGQCWLPTNHLPKVQALLNVSNDRAGNIINPIQSATNLPTYHATNSFTYAFQTIIDAYGTAAYKEVNPAVFSIITFPFLFSVMFGDAGHGVLMFAFALYLCICQKKLAIVAAKSEIFNMIFSGRYMILLMSIFSIYSGFMYNDFFSKSIALPKSAWKIPYTEKKLEEATSYTLDPAIPSVYPENYMFGIDPAWNLASNKITFTNSYKKKISIVFGVCQMLLGVILALFNHVYFKRYLNIFCDFIPMLIFLLSLFGYLVGLIFAKWIYYQEGLSFYNCSPNLLIDFINMFMMKYDDPQPGGCPTQWFTGQKPLQISLVALAALSAIWLLASKPLFLKLKEKLRKRSSEQHQKLVEDNDDHSPLPISQIGNVDDRRLSSSRGQSLLTSSLSFPTQEENHLAEVAIEIERNVAVNSETAELHGEKHDNNDVLVHQIIHTIEFCLGCVSHTASYLRLWALSLAHAQLSEVLWEMVLKIPLSKMGAHFAIRGLCLFAVFAPFAVLTLVILIMMEGLSAFLHTLRLHWVEFCSKFYQGDGVPFEPFSFELILKSSMD